MKDTKEPKIKVGVNKPLRPRVIPPETQFDRVAVHVGMVKAGPVFKNNKLLKFFWELHPTKAAIDATFGYLKHQGKIRTNPESPVFSKVMTREEKLAAIRIAMGTK